MNERAVFAIFQSSMFKLRYNSIFLLFLFCLSFEKVGIEAETEENDEKENEAARDRNYNVPDLDPPSLYRDTGKYRAEHGCVGKRVKLSQK